MIISHSHRFIFFSNPKTGSESVRDLLKPYSEQHITVFRKTSARDPFYSHISPRETRELFAQHGWDFSQYRKFVFVRNPWERLLSLFKMINRNKDNEQLNVLSEANKLRFEAWIFSIDNQGAGGGGNDADRWRKYGTYSILNYAGDENGTLLVDQIFRLEDIHQALPDYLNTLGMPRQFSQQDIPAINVAKKTGESTRDWYTDKGSDRVKTLYDYEIGKFDYALP